jgi:hypothetical protein
VSEYITVSNVAFGVAGLAILLVVVGAISNKHAILLGLGGVAVGLATKPGSLNNV